MALVGCNEGSGGGATDEVGDGDGDCATTGVEPDGEWSNVIDWSNAGNLYDDPENPDPNVLRRKLGNHPTIMCTDDEDCTLPGSYCAPFDGMTSMCADLRPHHDYLTAIHLVHMPTGELLMFHGEHDERVWTIGEPAEDMRWFPVPHHVPKIGQNQGYPDIFCSGHVLLPDGHVLVAGGNINGDLENGGLTAILSFNPFGADPDVRPYGWTKRDDSLVDDRWYPTLTVMADGRVLISGGASREDGRNSFELYDPIEDETEKLTVKFKNNEWGDMSMYPFMFLLPNGDVLYAGGEEARELTAFHGRVLVPGPTAGDWKWAEVDDGGGPTELEITSTINGGSAVMYAPGKIMKSGGQDVGASNAHEVTEVLDLSEIDSDDYPSSLSWDDQVDPMHQKRHFHTLTLLPDGRVLATGGNSRGNVARSHHRENDCSTMTLACNIENCPHGNVYCIDEKCSNNPNTSCEENADCSIACTGNEDCPSHDDSAQCQNGKCMRGVAGRGIYCIGTTCDPLKNECFATRTAEIWDPECKTWTELDAQDRPRLYHSTAALMPDGRVLSTGGGHRFAENHETMWEEHNVEYFEPVYGTGAKPEYTFALETSPPYLTYGGKLMINYYGAELSSQASLLKLAAVTHGFDQGQMYIPVTLTGPAPTYSVHGPEGPTIAPPGYYMLFIRTVSGAISTGQYIQVGHQFAGKWGCEATQHLVVEETVCDITPVNGECPSGYESQDPVALPVFDQSTEGWEVVVAPGTVEDPLAPTLDEIDSVLALCALACEQQWASAPEIGANCASSGVFETPELIDDEGIHMTLDLIHPDQQDGSGIFISEFTSESLNCTLGESCCYEFDELLCNATNHRPTEASAPQGGPAEYELSLSGTSTLTIGAGIPAVIGLSGEAAYGFCSSETSGACPFYLDRFEASSSGTTEVRLSCDDSSAQTVDVTNLELRLVQPAFGVEYGGYVGFPAGGLIFETTLEVDSIPYSYRRPISASFIGTAEDDDFELTNVGFDLTVPCNTSTSTVTVSFDVAAGTATASPPAISIVLPSNPPCSTAMDLDAMASDPDDDIVSVRWRMDGVLLSPTLTQVVPTGSHTLTAIAIDARGATTTTTETFQCN